MISYSSNDWLGLDSNTVIEDDDEIYRPEDIYIPPLMKYKHYNRRIPYTMEKME